MAAQPWIKLPDLSSYETIVLLDHPGQLVVKLFIGRQDGNWHTGYELEVTGHGEGSFKRSRIPNPKWSSFEKYHDAMEDVLNLVISSFIEHKTRYPDFSLPIDTAINVLNRKKKEIQNEQTKLF